jgi:hypothetical protein
LFVFFCTILIEYIYKTKSNALHIFDICANKKNRFLFLTELKTFLSTKIKFIFGCTCIREARDYLLPTEELTNKKVLYCNNTYYEKKVMHYYKSNI